jgi:hypothetical protein
LIRRRSLVPGTASHSIPQLIKSIFLKTDMLSFDVPDLLVCSKHVQKLFSDRLKCYIYFYVLGIMTIDALECGMVDERTIFQEILTPVTKGTQSGKLTKKETTRETPSEKSKIKKLKKINQNAPTSLTRR